MRTLIDFADAPVFAVPSFEGSTRPVGEGMLIEGPQGWGEFSPTADVDPAALSRWLTAAVEAGTVGWPDPVRGRVPVAVPVPAVAAAQVDDIVSGTGCMAADVVVGGRLDEDLERVAAVRDALGPGAAIRCNANGQWDIDRAVTAIPALDRAAGGLEFVVQPCVTRAELATVRSRVEVRIAARGWGIDTSAPLHDAADIAVLAPAAVGGVRRALRLAESCGLPCVVSATGQSSVGLAGGLALAGVLPELPFATGLGARLLRDADLVSAPRSLVPVDGCLPVAPMPPAPDRDLVDRYAVGDAERVAWWRDRLRVAVGGM